MSTKFLSPGWRMPRNANQSKSSNYSLGFDGGNQFINSSPTLSGLTDITVSCWAKFENINNSDFQYVLIAYNTSQSGGYRVGIGMIKSDYSTVSDRYKLYTIDGPNLNISSFVVSQDVWYNIVVTQSGTVRKLFVNGGLISTFTGVPSLNLGNNLEIGRFSNNNHYFPGKINSVSIFDYALSSSQVTTLYGTGSAIGNPMALPRTPIAYYPLGTSAWNGQYLAENNAIGDYVFDFNSSSNVVDTGTGLTITRDLTLSGWVKFTSTNSGGSTVISKHITAYGQPYYTYRLYIESNKAKFRVGINTATFITGSTDINDGEWHHILGTYDGSNINLYVDGVSDATAVSVSGDLNTSVRKTTIGGVINGDTNNLISTTVFNGELSNTQIFNTALSGPEVETLYNYGSPIQTLANIPQSSNLKAWYKLDATEIYNSTSTEWSVDNNQNPSAYPSSLYFDGNDYIDCGATVQQPTTNYSVSCWVKFTTIASAPTGIVGNFQGSIIPQRGYAITHQNGTPFQFWADGTASSNAARVQGITNPVANVWYNIVGTYDGANVKIYVNNVLENTVSYSATPATTNQNLKIGRWYGNIDDYYTNGSISNVSIWNAALTSTQVTEIYNNGTPSNLSSHSATSNLVSWWKLNNTTTGIEDSKGSNNGTNNGATEYPGFVNSLAGESSGMSQSNLVQSDLQTVAPYSKYALNFDGTGDYIDLNSDITLTGNKSVSFWVNFTSTIAGVVFGGASVNYYPYIDATNIYIRAGGSWPGDASSFAHGGLTAGIWYNVCIAGDGTNATAYLNGSSLGTQTDRGFTFKLINGEHTGLYGVDGKLSNCAIWNTVLTSSQVREIYNQGLPSNLHNFSGTAPVAWWQLGSNSFWNGNDWIVADEIGSNNGESDGMGVDALTNGVGTTANGTSTGMSESSLIGDAPYSTANAISSGMAVQAFDSETPPNVISGRSEDVPS